MVRLAHHKLKMKLLEAVADISASTSSSPSSSASSPRAAVANRKRKTPSSPAAVVVVDGRNPPPEQLRSSKRSRLQFIPYQSPESVEKIIAFSEQLSKLHYQSENVPAAAAGPANGSTSSNGNNNNQNNNSNQTSKAKKIKTEPPSAQPANKKNNVTAASKSNNKVSISTVARTSAKSPSSSSSSILTKKSGPAKPKKKVDTVQVKSTVKAVKVNVVAVTKNKKTKSFAATINKSKAQVKSKIFKTATTTASTKSPSIVSAAVKNKNKSKKLEQVPSIVSSDGDQQPSSSKKKSVVRKKKQIEDKTSSSSSTTITAIAGPSTSKLLQSKVDQNLNNGDVPVKKKRAKKRKGEEIVVKAEEIKKEVPVAVALKKTVRRKKGTLNPKPSVTVYDRDPTFETKLNIPHVSTLADSRALLIRAVLLKDNNLLQSLVKNTKKNSICSFCVPRSINVQRDALSYALESENIAAIKILTDDKLIEVDKLAQPPELILQSESTGHNSTMMFGHALRRVEVGRGGKEGNNAFNKDKSLYGDSLAKQSHRVNDDDALSFDISYSTIEKIQAMKENSYFLSNCIDSVVIAIRNGNRELAGQIVAEGNKRGGFGFNFLHEEVLLKNGEPLTPFKSVSVVKKAICNSRVTPLHCSAINQNPTYLTQLLNSRPEFSIHDSDNWTLLHYAAVAKGPGPLNALLSRGVISSLSINKQGETPLHLACKLGRQENVRLLVEHELASIAEGAEEQEEAAAGGKTPDKLTLTSLSKISKAGLTPLQVAAKFGYEKIIEYLLSTVPELDINKQTSANFDKLSPLMLACQFGHLSVVKLLAREEIQDKYNVKFDLPDKRGRTALTHAVMNGHCTIVSFLLRFGVNHQVKDSSGNTLVLYAAAYGWFFVLKLLLEAGCSVKEANHWKLSPLAVAFMKGHVGLVSYILDNGVDINSPVNDSTGMTLLLETCESRPSQDYLERIKFVLEKQHADCKVTDYAQNNALHKLVQVESNALRGSNRYSPYEGGNDQNFLFAAARLLLAKGCDLNAQNREQMSPLSLAVQCGCFSLLREVFLEHEGSGGVPAFTDKEGNTFLHLLAPHISKEVDPIYKNLSKKPANLKILTDMASTRNNKGETPLLLFLKTLKSTGGCTSVISTFNNQVDQEYQSDDDDDESSNEEEEMDGEVRRKEKKAKETTATTPTSAETLCIKSLLRFMVNQLQSNVNAVIEEEKENLAEGRSGRSWNSVLHLAVDCDGRGSLGNEVLKIILGKKPNLEILNPEHRTPLALAIINSKEETARILIKAGAKVNIETGGQDKSMSKSLLLYICQQPVASSFSLVPLLIEKGASVFGVEAKTGNSPLHFICQRPTLTYALEAVQKLVTSGLKLNSVNKAGRTALHLVVNSRGGETDATYEIEDTLIEHSPESLSLWDTRGRIPLHYCFVKIGKFDDKSFIDPIELTAILVGAMKEANCRELIKSVDKFGCSPLHYAAARGATISSSFLLTESGSMAIIDMPDKNGNTPMGLSVLNGHEGCALVFQQKRGNFTLTLNCERKQVDMNDAELSSKERNNVWQWNHLKLVQEEDKKREAKANVYTILEKVVRRDWQGILHLMLESLKNSGNGISPGIYAAIKTHRYKLTLKLIARVKRTQELDIAKKEGTLLHILTRYGQSMGTAGELQILENLLMKGVDVLAVDELKSNAIIYAAVQRNVDLCIKLMEEIRRKSTETTTSFLKDSLGRTPFSALFYDLSENLSMSAELKAWATQILTYNSSSSSTSSLEANALCVFPLKLSDYPGVRFLRLEEAVTSPGPNVDSRFSPLIASVIYGSFDTVKWLLSLKGKVDLNGQDLKGRTALMHAVRFNDVKMVKLLLSPKTYSPSEDTVPWNSTSYYNPTNSAINLAIRDKDGLTVVDHLIRPSAKIPYSYANSEVILRILAKLKAPLNEKSGDGLTPLDRAVKLNRQHLCGVIQELLGIPKSKQVKVSKEYQDFASVVDQTATISSQDFHADAQAMRKKLVEAQETKEKKEQEKEVAATTASAAATATTPTPTADSADTIATTSTTPTAVTTSRTVAVTAEPDSLVGSEARDFTVMMDEEQKIPFDCVLTKVDLSYGMYGLYNFYKMQLLKKPKGNDTMILLFTRWGRVGDSGQYQKTPFMTVDEAVKEFKKIFKAKSGNAWEDVDKFVPMPKRYRLVHKDLRHPKTYNQVKIDFNLLSDSAKKIPSNITRMGKSVNDFIEHISLVHKSNVHLKGVSGSFGDSLPFGLLTTEVLAKGDNLLLEIGKLIEEKTQLAKNPTADPSNKAEQPGQKIMDKLVELSEEFYALVPVYGFASEKLTPIFETSDLKEKQEVIHSILHLEFASQLLLAAQFNIDKMNPFEYIYKCLGTKLQAMNRDEEEAQLLLQYIYNTSEGVKVQNIFRIERPGELEAMEELGLKNRWLLFHGTKTVNLLSILHRGLQVAPYRAQLSGHMFGKGIYFADMFKKSRSYCVGSGNQNFMFICEVALGNVHPVTVEYNSEDSKKPLPAGCQSILTSDSRFEPNPGTTIHYKGRTIPLGKPTTKILGRDRYYGMDYNEFIVFNPAQSRLKYLIQFQ